MVGARPRWVGHTLEVSGGRLAQWMAGHGPFGVVAITLGHVILGRDESTLQVLRAHEQVHVRQYERWGPLFVPAYLANSAWQWLRGRHPYLDNRFERQARAGEDALSADAWLATVAMPLPLPMALPLPLPLPRPALRPGATVQARRHAPDTERSQQPTHHR